MSAHDQAVRNGMDAAEVALTASAVIMREMLAQYPETSPEFQCGYRTACAVLEGLAETLDGPRIGG